MVVHFPDGKTEAQWLQSFAQSPKASQQPWLSIWLVLGELCFLLLLYLSIVPRKVTERGCLCLRNGRPYIDLKIMQ